MSLGVVGVFRWTKSNTHTLCPLLLDTHILYFPSRYLILHITYNKTKPKHDTKQKQHPKETLKNNNNLTL